MAMATGRVSAHRPEGPLPLQETGAVAGEGVAQAARIVERMINQNLHNDLAMDFKVCAPHPLPSGRPPTIMLPIASTRVVRCKYAAPQSRT